MDVVRARWSTSSFLLYAGALVFLVATGFLLGNLGDDYRQGAFFGWSALVLAVVLAFTIAFWAAADRLVAGLFAVTTTIAVAVFAGSFLDLIGLLDDEPFGEFDVGVLLVYLSLFFAAVVLLPIFRVPLLVVPAAAGAWFFMVDLVSNGGDWTAIVAILVGPVFMLAGAIAGRWYGFWLHAVAGLSMGGGFLYLWHSAHWEWILIGIIALVYFMVAAGLERSSYAVFGAIGAYLAWSHFVEDWFGTDDEPYIPSFFDGGAYGGNDVARILLYALYGLALVVLGLRLQRRRGGEWAAEETVAPA